MDLKNLLAAGVIVQTELLKRTVVWKHTDENNKKIETEFDVHIKKEASAADVEFIYFNRANTEGTICRRVSRMVFLGENGCDVLPHEQVCEMQWKLVLALNEAINKVEKEFAPKDEDTKTGDGDKQKN